MIEVAAVVLDWITLVVVLLLGTGITAFGVFLCVNAFLLRRSNKAPFRAHLAIGVVALALGVLVVFNAFAKIAESACG